MLLRVPGRRAGVEGLWRSVRGCRRTAICAAGTSEASSSSSTGAPRSSIGSASGGVSKTSAAPSSSRWSVGISPGQPVAIHSPAAMPCDCGERMESVPGEIQPLAVASRRDVREDQPGTQLLQQTRIQGQPRRCSRRVARSLARYKGQRHCSCRDKFESVCQHLQRECMAIRRSALNLSCACWSARRVPRAAPCPPPADPLADWPEAAPPPAGRSRFSAAGSS